MRLFWLLLLTITLGYTDIEKDNSNFNSKIRYKINGNIISEFDINQAVEMNEKLKKIGFPIETDKKIIIDNMIKSLLLKDELQKNNVFITEVDVNNHILSIGRLNNIKTIDDFKDIILKMGVDWDYFVGLQTSKIYEQYIMRMISSNYSLDDEEIKSYYEENKDDFFVDKILLIDTIYISKDDDMSFSDISDLIQKIEDIHKELEEGVVFEELKEKNNKEIVKADWKVKSDYDWAPDIWNKINSLKKNEYTDVIDTTRGLYILKVLDIKENEEMPYNKIKEKIKNEISAKKNMDKLKNKIIELKEKAFIKEFK